MREDGRALAGCQVSVPCLWVERKHRRHRSVDRPGELIGPPDEWTRRKRFRTRRNVRNHQEMEDPETKPEKTTNPSRGSGGTTHSQVDKNTARGLGKNRERDRRPAKSGEVKKVPWRQWSLSNVTAK